MSTASAICQIRATSLGDTWIETTSGAIHVTPGETIQVRLASPSGAGIWALDVYGTDDVVVAPEITQAYVPSGTATFVAPSTPATGWSLLLRSRTGWRSLCYDANGIEQPEYTATFKLVKLTGNGLQLLAKNENLEGNPTAGTAGIIDEAIRRTTGGTGEFSGDATSIQSRAVAVTAPLAGSVLYSATGATWAPQVLTADMIAPGFAVTSFAATTPQVEVGTSVVHPAFTASYSTTPDATAGSVVITNDSTAESLDVSATPTSFTSAGTFTLSTFGQAVTFTNTAKKGTVTKTATTAITALQYLYWGGDAAGLSTSAAVKALANKALRSSANTGQFTASVSAGQKFYLAIRSAWTVQIKIGGFVTTFITRTVSVTNGQGFAENYTVYESGSDTYGSNFLVEVTQQ